MSTLTAAAPADLSALLSHGVGVARQDTDVTRYAIGSKQERTLLVTEDSQNISSEAGEKGWNVEQYHRRWQAEIADWPWGDHGEVHTANLLDALQVCQLAQKNPRLFSELQRARLKVAISDAIGYLSGLLQEI